MLKEPVTRLLKTHGNKSFVNQLVSIYGRTVNRFPNSQANSIQSLPAFRSFLAGAEISYIVLQKPSSPCLLQADKTTSNLSGLCQHPVGVPIPVPSFHSQGAYVAGTYASFRLARASHVANLANLLFVRPLHLSSFSYLVFTV